jgi:hypothetical protein
MVNEKEDLIVWEQVWDSKILAQRMRGEISPRTILIIK